MMRQLRTIRFLLRKEFLQIIRNRAMLPIIFVLPVAQLLILAHAATFEVRNSHVALVDRDRSVDSRRLVSEFESTSYFDVTLRTASIDEANRAMLAGDVRMILVVPNDFSSDLRTGHATTVQMVLDAQDGAAAGVVQAYAQQIVARFDRDLLVKVSTATPPSAAAGNGQRRVEILPAFWYNPGLVYADYMVPGILVVLVTVVGTFLSAMNVVREKEIGTIEQLNVTPLSRGAFIIGKLLPFWIIALFELAFGLVLARLVFDIPILGSIPLIFALGSVYLLVMLGIGLWISTITETQQQAMFVAWFIVVIFILMSGLFTPIESMPKWAQTVTYFNPIAHFIEIMRRVLLKGAGFAAVREQFTVLAVYAVVVLTLAATGYRKVAG